MKDLLDRLPVHVAFGIAHNPHHSWPCPLDEYIDGTAYCGEPIGEWASEADRIRSLELDELWEIRWYPITHICFKQVWASTLEAALNACRDP
jgi:hypothetical protein